MDLMNLTRRQRSRWIIGLPECYRKRVRIFKVPYNIIKNRNDMLFDEKFIPENRLREMWNIFELPTVQEFDQVL